MPQSRSEQALIEWLMIYVKYILFVIFSDRQEFEREIMELRRNNVTLETALHIKTKENAEIGNEVLL